MIQVVLFVAIHLLGVAFAVAVGPHRRVHLCCAFGFLVGLVVWVVSLFAALCLGLPSAVPTFAALYALLLAGLVAIAARRGRLARSLVWPIVGWTAGFALVAGVLTTFNITRFSPDSYNFIMAAHALAADGLVHLAWSKMAERGVFHPIAHSMAPFVGYDYLYSYHLTLTASFVAAFALLLFQGLCRAGDAQHGRGAGTRVVVVFLATSAMMTTYIVTWHSSYIHGNLSGAIYLWMFVALFWLAELDEDTELATLSAVAMLGCALQRLESGVVVAIFLTLALAETRLASRSLARDFGIAIAVTSAWLVLIAANASSLFVSPSKSAGIIVLMIAPFVYWRSGLWPKLRPRIAPLSLAAMVIALAAAIVTAPELMSTAAGSLFENVFVVESMMWGYTPLLLIALAILVARAPRIRFDRIFAYGIPLLLLFIYTIVRLRGAYRVGWGDSGNRMLLYAVPLLFFYFALRLGILAGRAPRASAHSTHSTD